MALSSTKRNQVVLLLMLAVGAVLIFSLKGLIASLLGTIVVYTLFRPMLVWLVEKKKMRKTLASGLVLATSFFAIVVPLFFLILILVNKISAYSSNSAEIQHFIENLNNKVGGYINQPDLLKTTLKQGQSFIIGFFTNFLGGFFDFLLQVVVMYFLLYFLFADYQLFESTLKKYAPFSAKNTLRFAQELKASTYSNILGQGLIALIQGLLLALGFVIFNFSDPFFWGVVTVVLSMMPVIGAPVVFVPAGIYALLMGDNFAGIGILIYGFVLVINIDNVIRFAINKRIANTHPIVTLLGVIIGVPLFGMLGIVFGPLLFSFFILLVKIYKEHKPEKATLKPIETNPTAHDRNN